MISQLKKITKNNTILHDELNNIICDLINNKNYNNKPIIHLYGDNNDGKILFTNIIKTLYCNDEYKVLNNTLLHNSYSSWYNDNLKICFLHNIHPSFLKSTESSLITLSQNKILLQHNMIIQPNLKFIILSNYEPNVFTKNFNDICTHIYL